MEKKYNSCIYSSLNIRYFIRAMKLWQTLPANKHKLTIEGKQNNKKKVIAIRDKTGKHEVENKF